jgi:putative FmdB family regulatory protein
VPTYTYLCKKCGHEWLEFHAMSATPKLSCPSCKSRSVEKQLGTGAGIIFKGSGFYETDFKEKKGAKPSESGEAKKEGKTETKPETKTEAKPAKAETKKPAKKAKE